MKQPQVKTSSRCNGGGVLFSHHQQAGTKRTQILNNSTSNTSRSMHTAAKNLHQHHHNHHSSAASSSNNNNSSSKEFKIISSSEESSSATLLTISSRRSGRSRRIGGGGGGSINIIISKSSSRLAFIALTLACTVSLILLAVTQEAHSLNCYTCSSADNPACDEPFSGRANFNDTDCEKQIGRPAKVCRKIVQYIEDKKVVLRSCGWIDERADNKGHEKESMCYKRSGTFALMMESCVCYEDNCNHSASLVPTQSVLTLLTACSIVYFYLAKRIPSQVSRAEQLI